jgi:hypothetical protein
VIEDVPRDPTSGVALRPPLLDEWCPFRRSLDGVSNRGAKFRDRTPVVPVGWCDTESEFSDVRALTVTNVVRHLVPVAAAAAGTLAEFGWRGREDLVIDDPGGIHERCEPLSLIGRQWRRVALCDFSRHPEFRARRSFEALDNAKRAGFRIEW